MFPAVWKQGKIKMLNKPGKDPTEKKSCRPITLLPILGKMYEKIIKLFVNKQIQKRQILMYTKERNLQKKRLHLQ